MNLSIVDRSIKRQSIEMKGNAELARFERLMLCDQHCTVICIDDCILYLINSSEFQSLTFAFKWLLPLRKAVNRTVLLISPFHNLSIDIFEGFLENDMHTYIFLEESKLIELSTWPFLSSC